MDGLWKALRARKRLEPILYAKGLWLTIHLSLSPLSPLSNEQGVKERPLLIAGTGCVGTRETIELTNVARELGYDAAMLVTPVPLPKSV